MGELSEYDSEAPLFDCDGSGLKHCHKHICSSIRNRCFQLNSRLPISKFCLTFLYHFVLITEGSNTAETDLCRGATCSARGSAVKQNALRSASKGKKKMTYLIKPNGLKSNKKEFPSKCKSRQTHFECKSKLQMVIFPPLLVLLTITVLYNSSSQTALLLMSCQ